MTPSAERPKRFIELPSVHVMLDIAQVDEFPVLAACLDAWRRASVDGLPSTLDPLEVPPQAIKGINLIEWSDEAQDWILRLSSSLFDEAHGRVMTGAPLSTGFSDDEIDAARARISAAVASGRPSLARHEFADPTDKIWAFVRLILPLSKTGEKPDSYALVVDPDTFGKRISR